MVAPFKIQRKRGLLNRLWTIIGMVCALAALSASAVPTYESLDTVLERGYVREWLVCGPFPSDQDGGIAAALRHGLPPVGSTDYLASLGGISRIRPEPGLRVEHPEGYATWSRRTTDSPALDLSDFFLDRREGVFYAAFLSSSTHDRPVYLEGRAPAGLRIWVNGFPLDRDHGGLRTGVARGIARFRQGANRVIIQAPLVALEALETRSGGWPLTVQSGFEIGLRVLPVQSLGALAYVPRLEPGRTFTDESGQVFQRGLLTLFNPDRRLSEAVTVTGAVIEGDSVPEQIILPVPPGEPRVAELAIPTGERLPGETLRLRLTLATNTHQTTITTSLPLGLRAEEGTVYVLCDHAGPPHPEMDVASWMEAGLDGLDRRLALADSEPDYGFVLGDGPLWTAYIAARPHRGPALRTLADQLRCAPHAAFGPLDERIVGGELLIRNLAYGHDAAHARLGQTGGVHYAGDAAALAPQSAQILSQSNIRGIITNAPFPGEPGLFALLGPDGSRIAVRSKRPVSPTETLDAFFHHAEAQRTELLRWGIDTDLLVLPHENPESFLLGRITELRQSVPSIRFDAQGGEAFFRRVDDVVSREGLPFHETGRLLTAGVTDVLLRRIPLVQAHGRAETALAVAERMATQAALTGADYPEALLDHGWRQLLAWGHPATFGETNDRMVYDGLAAYRALTEDAIRIREAAATFLASQTDTRSRDADAMESVVVFNPSGHARTDVCEIPWPGSEPVAIELRDETGHPVPYTILPDPHDGEAQRVVLVAADVPPLGHRVFHVFPGGEPEPFAPIEGNLIGNAFVELSLDAAAGGTMTRLACLSSGEIYESESLDDVVLFPRVELSADDPNGIAIPEAPARPSEEVARVSMEGNDMVQRAVVEVPFAGGTMTREWTIYSGVPRIEGRIWLEGVSEPGLVALVHRLASPGALPMAGERFGAAALPQAATTDEGFPVTLAFQPALGWLAHGSGDRLRFGSDAAISLAPTVIDRGESADLDEAAAALRQAWVRRALPAVIYPPDGPPQSKFWTDSAVFPDFREEMGHGLPLRILLAAHDRMQEVERLLEQMPDSARTAFYERRADGAAFYVEDVGALSEGQPTPTLVIAGDDVSAVIRMARSIARSIELTGMANLPPALGGEGPVPVPSGGVALLHEGTAFHWAGRNNTMLTALFFGGSPATHTMTDTPALPDAKSGTFRYALYPFSGTWREAGLPEAAQGFSEPLIGAITGLHDGPLPPRHEWLGLTATGMTITAFKPLGEPLAEGRKPDPVTRRGIWVRGYENRGEEWEGAVAPGVRHYRAEQRNLLGHGAERLTTPDDVIPQRLSSWSLTSISFQTPGRMRPGVDAVPLAEPDHGPVFVRYWRHNTRVAPPGGLPVSVLLDSSSEGRDRLRVSVVNHTADRMLAGRVRFTAGGPWTLAESALDYELEAGGSLTREITVLGMSDAPGGVMAETAVEGRRYYDVFGTPPAIGITAKHIDQEVIVRIENQGLLPLHGDVRLITPPSHWPALGGPGATHPDAVRLSIAPGETVRAVFFVHGRTPPWMTVRAAFNGHMRYIAVPDYE